MSKDAQEPKQKTPKGSKKVSVPTRKEIVRSFRRVVQPVKKKP